MVRARVGAQTRRVLVFVHIASSVGWMGAGAANVVLASTALVTDSPVLRHTCYSLIQTFDTFLVIPLAFLTLVGGVAVSIVSPWGLLRYWWVLIKLVLTMAVVALSTLGVSGWVADGIAAGASPSPSGATLVVGFVANIAAFLLMTWLSVAKPGGRVRPAEASYYHHEDDEQPEQTRMSVAEYARHLSKSESLARVLVVYTVAFVVFIDWVIAGPRTGHLWLDGLIADLLATLVVFVASRMYRNSSFYDAFWSVLPPALAIAWWVRSDAPLNDVRASIVLFVIVVWAARLTGNWIYAFPGLHHEDWRYPIVRERAGRFEWVADLMAIHIIPTLQVFAGMLPVYVVLTHRDRPIGWLDVVALVVGLAAVALEYFADVQMYRFTESNRPGQVMDRGLWAWSRHPNYFGEFSFWLALALFGLAAAPATWWWVFAGALLMLAMFQGASIPLMERRSLERRPAYQDVIDRVPRFVPRPPRASSR